MDRERLDRLMDDPARVRRADITDLKAMTERYPWFSAAHLLLAVGEHAAGDLLFDEQLRTTAAHLPSRAVLFDHVQRPVPAEGPVAHLHVVDVEQEVHGTKAEVPLPPVEEMLPAPTPPMQAEEVDEDEEEAGTDAAYAPVTHEAVSLPLPPPSAIEGTPVQGTSAATPGTVEPEAGETAPTAEEAMVGAPEAEPARSAGGPDPLDLQIREAALAGSYALTWDFEAELAAARATPVPLEDAPARPAPPPAPAAPAPVEAPITSNTRKRFTAWLDLALPAEPAELPDGLRLDQIASAPDAGDWLRETAPDAPAANVPPPPATTDTQQLIDRFIQQTGATPAKKAEFFTPQQAAKRSLEDHADLVSETLARVYEKQGNYAKAIAAYERLALKHPDKSAYFAALSEALRARSNR